MKVNTSLEGRIWVKEGERPLSWAPKWTFQVKKNYFLCLTKFKPFSQIKGNLINVMFLKFVISFRGGGCDYSPPGAKNAWLGYWIVKLLHSTARTRHCLQSRWR
jgi:hypothetical protein